MTTVPYTKVVTVYLKIYGDTRGEKIRTTLICTNFFMIQTFLRFFSVRNARESLIYKKIVQIRVILTLFFL